MFKLISIAVMVSLLSGCHWFTRTVYVDREVMVTVPCTVQVPQKPVMPLTESGKVTDNIYVKSQKALAENDLRKGYESELEAAAQSCSK
jgi:hypothetical protein